VTKLSNSTSLSSSRLEMIYSSFQID
jgi:hypothetical protein